MLGAFAKANLEAACASSARSALDAAATRGVRGRQAGCRSADVFKAGDFVDVTGTTKGKGFQGVMKRHHMAGFRATHGTHEFFRHGGSIGCRLTPGRVHKGKRMARPHGRRAPHGAEPAVVEVIPEKNLLLGERRRPRRQERLRRHQRR